MDTKTASYGKKSVEIPPKPLTVVKFLSEIWPRSASIEAIVLEMYPESQEPESAKFVTYVNLYNARKYLAKIGVKIDNHSHVGYRLVFPNGIKPAKKRRAA